MGKDSLCWPKSELKGCKSGLGRVRSKAGGKEKLGRVGRSGGVPALGGG